MAGTFYCTLVTPERRVLDEEYRYASIPAWDGQLGVEHQRSPLVTRLGHGPLRLDRADGRSQTYFISGGFAQVKENRLSIVTDQAVPASELDRAEAEAALSAALNLRATTSPERERKDKDVARARGMLATLR